MINIEQITSRLAKLPDQALQQYAMMHKQDPYIMALAVSESNRRKQMRTAAQAGPVQEQPKIADQALMDMAPQAAQPSPDEAGIASLPTGDMNFADGGIVAFADGGGTYETPYDRMNRQNREATAASAPREIVLPAGTSPQEASLVQMQNPDAAVRVEGTGGVWDKLGQAFMYSSDAEAQKARQGATGVAQPAARMTPQQMEAKVAAAPAAPKAKPEAGLAGTPEAAALRGAAGPSVEDAKKLSGQFLDTKSLRSDLDKFYKDEEAAVAASRKRRDEGKPEGEAYSKYEEMLKKEEAGAGKEKDEAQGVAIFKAGLAMMSGTSPRAFENIGKGAMAGLEEYSGAMKDMKKAAKERQKAMGEIEQARRAESRDDWKTAQAFEDKADARMAKAREFGVKGIMDITGKDAEIASGIYKTQVEQKGRMDVARLQAAAMRERGGPAGEKQTLAELKALQGSLTNQLKTEFNKDQRTAINAQLAQVNAEIAKMAGLGTMSAAPGAASPGGTRPPLSSFQR